METFLITLSALRTRAHHNLRAAHLHFVLIKTLSSYFATAIFATARDRHYHYYRHNLFLCTFNDC